MKNLKLVLKGGVIGVANIIPGVSGGTMAVVLGIYAQLIESIGNFATRKEKRREYAFFLAKVAIGAVAMVLLLSWVMDFLLTKHPKPTYLFFIGLIAGSIPSVYRGHSDMRPTRASSMSYLLGTTLILSFAILFPNIEGSRELSFEYEITASGLAILFIGGIFAGGSMIVPGISGSFILVLIGQYAIVIKAIKEFNLLLLTVIGLGVAGGIWGFAKLIDLCLKRFPKETFYFILALVVTSLYPIFPGFPTEPPQLILSIALVLFGASLAFVLGQKKA